VNLTKKDLESIYKLINEFEFIDQLKEYEEINEIIEILKNIK